MRSLLTFIVPLNSLFLLTISIQSAFFIFKSNDRPPMFVPKNQLKSIACGRGNGTRFVDMQIQLEEDHSIPSVKFDLMELTNIPRDELAVLDTYIHKTLIPSMLNDISNDGKQKDDQTEEEDDSNNDDNTDEDQEENDDNKKQNTKKRPRSRRACAQEARRITKSQINKVPVVDDEESDSADDEDVVFQNDSDTSNSDSDDEDSISLESDTESDHDDDDVGDDDMQTAKKSKTI